MEEILKERENKPKKCYLSEDTWALIQKREHLQVEDAKWDDIEEIKKEIRKSEARQKDMDHGKRQP